MNETYYYPYNLKSQAKLWLWNLRDVVIIGVALLLSILAMTQIKFYPYGTDPGVYVPQRPIGGCLCAGLYSLRRKVFPVESAVF